MKTPRPPWRTGRPWRRLAAQVKDEETHCGICRYPVNQTLPGTYKWGPVIDHIRSPELFPPDQQRQAGLDRDNVQLAHRRCNQLKGLAPTPPTAAARAEYRRAHNNRARNETNKGDSAMTLKTSRQW